MELFTLGIGHYTEGDVKEAARSLTGWTVVGDSFREDPAQHDDGEKALLGRRGRWTGTDLVAMLLEHPATAERLAWRICDTFLGEGDIDDAEIRLLAAGLTPRDLATGWVVGTVLRSRALPEGRDRARSCRRPGRGVRRRARCGRLERCLRAGRSSTPPPWQNGRLRLGEDLFYPPNVGGWPGGRSWISAGAMIGRTNFAAALAGGRDIGLPGPPDILALTERHGFGRDLGAVTTIATGVLLGVDSRTGRYPSLEGAPRSGLPKPDAARRIVSLVLSSLQAQKS